MDEVMTSQWATTAISLLSVIVGAVVSIIVGKISADSSVKIGLINEQREILMHLSKLSGEAKVSLNILEQIIRLNQADVLKDQFDKLQNDIKSLSTYYYEKRIVLSSEIRKNFDTILKYFTNVSMHTYLAIVRTTDDKHLTLSEDGEKRTEYIKVIQVNLAKIEKINIDAEKAMRKELGVEK